MTILEYLQEKSLSIAAECGGNGTCGKCLVKIKGRPGVFRACRTEYEQGMQISVVSKDEKMEAVTVQPSNFCKVLSPAAAVSEPAGIAIDIGTTTVAAAMASASWSIPMSLPVVRCLHISSECPPPPSVPST